VCVKFSTMMAFPCMKSVRKGLMRGSSEVHWGLSSTVTIIWCMVCDKDKGRLQIFKLDGSHVASVEGEATKLASPEFIAVSRQGHLFVTDPERNCVHVFH